MADLEATLRSGQCLMFSIEGYTPRQVQRLAARMNALGRRHGRDFGVRTRKVDGNLAVWAIPRQLARPRKRGGYNPEAVSTTA